MPQDRFQPALFGGLFLGVLSVLPFVNIANCCCLWVIGGGVLAAYLLQQNHPFPITLGDGAFVGLLAGLIGAVVYGVLSVPVNLLMGPLQQRMVEDILRRSRDLPPEMHDLFTGYAAGAAGMVIGFILMFVISVIFATLGGLLGAAIFKRNGAPSSGTVDVLPPQ
jgi:hypothetical protein